MPDAPLIRIGNTGGAVAAAQWFLNDVDVPDPALALDGIFGPLTRAAVQRFQSDAVLAADGIVGAKTWGAMVAVRNREPPAAGRIVAPQAPAVHSSTLTRQFGLVPNTPSFPQPPSPPSFSAGRAFTGATLGGATAHTSSAGGASGSEQAQSVVRPDGFLGTDANGDTVIGMIFFRTKETALDAHNDMPELKKMGVYKSLLEKRPIHFRFVGAADPRGSTTLNARLSKERAENVMKFVRHNVLSNHLNLGTQTFGIGEFKTAAAPLSKLRVVVIYGPHLKPPKKPKIRSLPDILGRLLFALVTDKSLPAAQKARLMCVITTLMEKDDADDQYLNGKESFWRQAVGGCGPGFTAQQREAFILHWKKQLLRDTVTGAKHSDQQVVQNVATIDDAIVEGLSFTLKKKVGNASLNLQCATVEQSGRFLDAKLKDGKSTYACYKGLPAAVQIMATNWS